MPGLAKSPNDGKTFQILKDKDFFCVIRIKSSFVVDRNTKEKFGIIYKKELNKMQKSL